MIRRGFHREICPDVSGGGGAKHIIKMSSNETIQDSVFVVHGSECGVQEVTNWGCVEETNIWENTEVKLDVNGKMKTEEHRSY